jgi:O-antigen ligase
LLLGLGVLSLLRGARAIAFVLLIALSSPLWLPEKVIERVQHTKGGTFSTENQELEDSAQVRVDQWKALPKIMKEAPIFGHGLRTFQWMWARYSWDHEPKAAHSTWIELLAEEGIVGILGYVWLVGLLGWTGFSAWRRRSDGLVKDLALGFMCAILCLMVLDTSGTRFRNREVMAYIWVLGGALARQVAESRRAPVPSHGGLSGPAAP